MIDLKDWNVKNLGNMIVMMIVLLFLVTIVHLVISPLFVSLLPTVFATKLTLSETLLFLILLRSVMK